MVRAAAFAVEIPQERGGLARVEDHQIEVAVVVEVIAGDAAGRVPLDLVEAGGGRDVDESPVDVAEEEVVVAVGGGVVEGLDVVVEVAAGEEQVAPAVVVEVGHCRPPGDELPRPAAGGGGGGGVLELPPPEVAEEDGEIGLEVGDEQVDPPVAVGVARFGPHATDLGPEPVHRHAGRESGLTEVAPAIVLEEEVSLEGVVADVDVGVAIVVVIETDNPHSRASHRGDPHLDARIDEAAIA